MAIRTEAAAALTLGDLLGDFVERANELRYRVMDMPNPMYEDENGSCLHSEEYGCSWRCPHHDFGPKSIPTKEDIRTEIRARIGAALFAVLDGYGEEVTRIEAVLLPIDLREELGRN